MHYAKHSECGSKFETFPSLLCGHCGHLDVSVAPYQRHLDNSYRQKRTKPHRHLSARPRSQSVLVLSVSLIPSPSLRLSLSSGLVSQAMLLATFKALI